MEDLPLFRGRALINPVIYEDAAPSQVMRVDLRTDSRNSVTQFSLDAMIEDVSSIVTMACGQLRTIGFAATAPEKLAPAVRLKQQRADHGFGEPRFRFCGEYSTGY